MKPQILQDIDSINGQLAEKASQSDNNRTTTAKDVTGAINELNANVLTKASQAQVDLLQQNKAEQSDLLVQKSRIDGLATLNQGSTTGDAELIGGRTLDIGVPLDNIGNAIRSVLTNNDFSKSPLIYGKNAFTFIEMAQGGISGTGVDYASANQVRQVSSIVGAGQTISVINRAPTVYRFHYRYFNTSNGAYIGGSAYVADAKTDIVLAVGTTYRLEFQRIDGTALVPTDIYKYFSFYFSNDGKDNAQYLDIKQLKTDRDTLLTNTNTLLYEDTVSPSSFDANALSKFHLESGQINVGGTLASSTIRARTPDYFIGDGKAMIICNRKPSVYKMWICEWDSNTTWIANYGSYNVKKYYFTFKNGYRYKILFGRVDNAVLTLDEIRANLFYFYKESESGAIKRRRNIKCIAHQGYNIAAPNESVKSYIDAANHGFDYGECDIKFTSDNIPVCNHNAVVYADMVNMRINPVITAASGNYTTAITIGEHTLAELQAYDWGYWKSSYYTGTTIAKFEDVLKTCKMYGIGLYIDHCDQINTQAKYDIMFGIINKYGMRNKVTWLNPDFSKVLAWNSKARIGVTVDTYDSSLIAYCNQYKTSDNDVFLNILYSGLTEANTVEIHQNNMSIESWTIDDPTIYQTWLPLVDGITSDMYMVDDVI